jgi:hypothetical protein
METNGIYLIEIIKLLAYQDKEQYNLGILQRAREYAHGVMGVWTDEG